MDRSYLGYRSGLYKRDIGHVYTSEIPPCYEIKKVTVRSYETKSFPGYQVLACA